MNILIKDKHNQTNNYLRSLPQGRQFLLFSVSNNETLNSKHTKIVYEKNNCCG